MSKQGPAAKGLSEASSSDEDGGQSQDRVQPKVEEEPKQQSKVPTWISSNLSNSRSLKTLFRCWLASWATLILILPNSSLQVLGQAAFFALLLTFMIPANMPVSLFLLANLTLVVGACTGWSFACAAMAASLRARNQVFLQQQLQKTYSSIAGATNPDSEFQVAIFQGNFLDVRSTTVFGVFLVVGAYFAGIVQAKLPKLKIAALFLLILMDIMCSYGPLFPFAQYTLATILLIPIGCSVAISLACQFLIFPETLNSTWQYNLITMLGMARQIIGTHQSAMERMLHEEPHTVEKELDPKIRQLHVGVIGLAEAMGGQRGLLELEVTYGRLSGKDLGQLYGEVRTIVVRMFGLNAFFHLLEDREFSKEDEHTEKGPVALHETHAILRFRQHMTDSEAKQHVELKTLLPILIESSRRTLKAVDACLETTSSWLDASVKRVRNYNHEEWISKLENCRTELDDSLQSFLTEDRLKIIEPYKYLFTDPQAHLSPESQKLFRLTARPLFICLVFAANLQNFTEEMLKAHGSIIELAKKRSRNKVWFPTGLRKLGKILMSKKPVIGSSSDDAILTDLNKYEAHNDEDEQLHHDDDDQTSQTTKVDEENTISPLPLHAGKPEPRDPDALPPTRLLHHFGRFMSACYHFAWSPAGVFALRNAVVTFALWIPAVLPSSAYFVYLHRGLWALIMGQTGLALSGGELIFSLGGRLAGTLVGLVIGMLYWYMSCGLAAQGNPYGLAAVCAIGFIPIVFLRIFAPPILILPAIMTGVTTALCVGYSWIDAHLTVLANSGIGYQIAWRRALLVIIGMAAAFVVTIFPRPPSTRRMVRQGFAQSTDGISRLYSIIVESWIVFEKADDEKDSKTTTASNTLLSTTLRARFIAAQGTLGGLNRDIGLATLDVSFRGSWPKEKYQELLTIHSRLLEAIAQMAGALTGLDVTWRRKMLHTTAMLNPATISDICTTLSILASALRTAKPLPHASTLLQETTIMNQSRMREMERARQAKVGSYEDLLTLETIQDAQFMKHTAAVMALITFVRQLDKFRAVLRELVGEIDLPGYDELKRHYDQRMIQSYIGGEEAADSTA